MRLKELEVSGYRSLESVRVPLTRLTAFIGPNGSGKSSVLECLRLFFEPSRTVRDLDFWSGKEEAAADTISIRVTWDGLSERATSAFSDFLTRAGELEVERRFEEPGAGAYVASRMAVPEFATIRNLQRGHRDDYHRLVEGGTFQGLERASNKDQVFEQMRKWEQSHPERCELREEEVDLLPLMNTFVTFLYVGAFEDPAEHLDASGRGAVSQLLARTVDKADVQARLQEVVDEATRRSDGILLDASEGFEGFKSSVEDMLDRFAPGCRFNLAWEQVSLKGSPPRLTVEVETADGLARPIEYQGHGIQRSLMYAALTAQATAAPAEDATTVLLVIEEPEAFQHPLSCRVLSRTMRELATRNYQVAYSTHSPEFVHADVIDGLRIVRRDDRSGRGAATYVEAMTGGALLTEWQRIFDGQGYSVESVLGRLHAHLPPHVVEGLFASACILVEGDEDEAIIRATAVQLPLDLDAEGVAVVQTNGKTGMPNVLAFLCMAGIRCFPVFDLDRGKPVEKQHREAETQIMRSLVLDEDPAAGVHERYASWQDDFGTAVSTDFGDRFEALMETAAEALGYSPSRGRKVPAVISSVLNSLTEEGLTSRTLQDLGIRLRQIAAETRKPSGYEQ